MLILSIALYIIFIGLIVLGAILLNNNNSIGGLPLALGIIGVVFGFIPF